ncbi:hypothetical protein ACFVWR_07055 [Leifsonia sp. NPDC058292]|uniref:hypothetical protein n=1 Tax=Leifsonia sp. NPDC058292 TaxID=3346428 RepID=UPI0036DC68E0
MAPETRTSLADALDVLEKTAGKTDVAVLARGPVKPRDGSLAAVQKAVSEAKASARRNTTLAGKNTSARAALAKVVAAVDDALTAMTKSAGSTSGAVLAANPNADPAVRDAFAAQAAAAAKATGQQAITALADYAVKGRAVVDSHATAVAAEQAAAAEAARKAAAGNGGAPGGGGTSRGTTSGGGASGGGGGTGGATGGGAGGGTSAGSPATGGGAFTPPRGLVVLSGACSGAGGSASGNWTSNLVAPTNALNIVVTFEHPGDSWGISWTCDTGW